MVFSSLTFVFLFLPVVLSFYYLAKGIQARNLILLLFSLGFYAWGEGQFLFLLLASVAFNFLFGLGIERLRSQASRKVLLASAIVLNLSVIVYFKYSHFIFGWKNIHLPIGISFYTFEFVSYCVDIFHGKTKAQRNPVNLALYVSLFPHLVAGPVVRYEDIAEQLSSRTVSLALFSEGIFRFITGLAKKVLIGNTVGQVADLIFNGSSAEMGFQTAWLGAICYTLQIYFDFSGYSDMAIGLAKMFGFHFKENFNYPYLAKTITDFWRRWHISLSTWFRDYLYIPLGGSRRGPLQTYRNLFLVFALCGLWHGAQWTFVIWGVYHGTFLILERVGFSRFLEKCPSPLQHLYTLLVVIVGWVFFRTSSAADAIGYLQKMFYFGLPQPPRPDALSSVWGLELWAALFLGSVLSLPSAPWLVAKVNWKQGWIQGVARVSLVAGLYLLTLSKLSEGTFNPFIYFRF